MLLCSRLVATDPRARSVVTSAFLASNVGDEPRRSTTEDVFSICAARPDCQPSHGLNSPCGRRKWTTGRASPQNGDVAFTIPERLATACRSMPDGARWLARLPDTLRDLEQRWSLLLGAPFDEGNCAWVAPVTLANGASAVLKLGVPHMESEHEIEGLRFWGGDPTVRLLDADDDLGAMLLDAVSQGQRCVSCRSPSRIWSSPSSSAPVAVARRPASVPTSVRDDGALERGDAGLRPRAGLIPGLVREGLRLFKELPQMRPRDVLLATDLHAGNVLRARREPWLVIDPKPFVGDPAYDATQHLLNCPADCARTRTGGPPLCGPAWRRSRSRSVVAVCPRGHDDGFDSLMDMARSIALKVGSQPEN